MKRMGGWSFTSMAAILSKVNTARARRTRLKETSGRRVEKRISLILGISFDNGK